MEEIISLHKYWIYSDRMRLFFVNDLKGNSEEYTQLIKKGKNNWFVGHPAFLGEHFIFKSYWYASLYVVIEGFLELKIDKTDIEEYPVPENINKRLLFRNGTFHFQKDIYSRKVLDVDDTDAFVGWIHKIHKILGIVIVREMAKKVTDDEGEQIFNQIKETIGFDFKKWIQK